MKLGLNAEIQEGGRGSFTTDKGSKREIKWSLHSVLSSESHVQEWPLGQTGP